MLFHQDNAPAHVISSTGCHSTVDLILGPAYLLLFYFILFYFYMYFYDLTGYLECYLGCVFVVFLCFYFIFLFVCLFCLSCTQSTISVIIAIIIYKCFGWLVGWLMHCSRFVEVTVLGRCCSISVCVYRELLVVPFNPVQSRCISQYFSDLMREKDATALPTMSSSSVDVSSLSPRRPLLTSSQSSDSVVITSEFLLSIMLVA